MQMDNLKLRWRRATVVVAVLAGLAAAIPAATADDGPSFLVYGDSLVHEASPYVHRMLREIAGVDAKAHGAPGGAPCDLREEMVSDAARYRPAAVVIAFSGNAFTSCMRDRNGEPLRGDRWLAKYRADTLRVIEAFRDTGALVWLATAPISFTAELNGEDGVHRLAAMYRELATAIPYVRVADAARSVLVDGRWTRTLPCLPREPCTGGVDLEGRWANHVRSPDGVHFCPVPYPTFDNCPVYASGGLRYALGLVVPALGELGLFDGARLARTIGAGWSS